MNKAFLRPQTQINQPLEDSLEYIPTVSMNRCERYVGLLNIEVSMLKMSRIMEEL